MRGGGGERTQPPRERTKETHSELKGAPAGAPCGRGHVRRQMEADKAMKSYFSSLIFYSYKNSDKSSMANSQILNTWRKKEAKRRLKGTVSRDGFDF